MRILLVNKFLYPAGGAETVFFNEWRWLEAAGHEVIPFGMAHPGNVSSPYSRFWVSQIDYRHPTPSQLVNLVWSSEAAEKLARLMAETRPHVAHLHNVYHQLSPSILSTLRKAKVPAVMTLHDYKLICPNYRLFTQGQPCQRCVHSHAWHAVRHRCLKDSLAASGLAAVETTLHRRLRSYDSLARLIAPSYFVQEQIVAGGFKAERVVVIPHAHPLPNPPPLRGWEQAPLALPGRGVGGEGDLPSPWEGEGPGVRVFLFAGRLEEEKGLRVLLSAAAQLPHISIAIAGDGPLRSLVEATKLPNVVYLGQLTAAELAQWRGRGRALVMPSIWYEVFGMSALEAMSEGLPVIASRIGALPELVEHEQTGLLIEPGNAQALAAAILRLWQDETLAHRLGAAGREKAQIHYSPERYMISLMALFESVKRET